MYNLVVVPNNTANFGVGHFKLLVDAERVMRDANKVIFSKQEKDAIIIKDDYGTILCFPADHISYIAIVDVQRKAEATIEAKIDEARANKAINERMATDKELQLLSRFVQQPQQPVIQMVPQGEQDKPAKPN